MAAATFTVTNDQTGDTKEVTLKEFESLRLQAYRVVDAAGYENASAAEPESTDDSAAEGAEDSASEDGYDALTVPELKAEIDRRGLAAPSDARKADLIKLLQDDDES